VRARVSPRTVGMWIVTICGGWMTGSVTGRNSAADRVIFTLCGPGSSSAVARMCPVSNRMVWVASLATIGVLVGLVAYSAWTVAT
jgi:hypothetical protein